MSDIGVAAEEGPVEARRIRTFARFFKNYMSVSSIIVAALPIPVTALHLIPTYRAHTSMLSTYTPMFCFLVLAFVFYSRHWLGRVLFTPMSGEAAPFRQRCVRWFVAILPGYLICLSLLEMWEYNRLLSRSIGALAQTGDGGGAEQILRTAGFAQIPDGSTLMLHYVSVFLLAEAAFVIMAVREYLQDLLKISDTQLISGRDSS